MADWLIFGCQGCPVCWGTDSTWKMQSWQKKRSGHLAKCSQSGWMMYPLLKSRLEHPHSILFSWQLNPNSNELINGPRQPQCCYLLLNPHYFLRFPSRFLKVVKGLVGSKWSETEHWHLIEKKKRSQNKQIMWSETENLSDCPLLSLAHQYVGDKRLPCLCCENRWGI